MRRAIILGCLLAAAVATVPARAQPQTGSIDVAIVDPSIARQMYLFSDKLDGIVGDVVQLSPAAGQRPFQLSKLTGATGSEDLDIWFYRELDGTGEIGRASCRERV